jgi:STE24 endopeptidase
LIHNGDTAIMHAGLVVAFVLAIGPFLGFRAYARRVETMDEPVEDRLHRLDRVQRTGGVVLPIVAVVAFFTVGPIDSVTEIAGIRGPELFGIPLLEFGAVTLVAFGVVVLPIASMVLGTYPTVRSLRDTSASPRRVARGVLAATAITIVSVSVAVIGVVAVTSLVGSSIPVLLATLGAIVVLSFGLSPYLIALFRDRAPLSGERRERVDRCCTELGYRPRSLSLLEGESTKTANAIVSGTVPGLRYVFLTDYLLAACDDDELRAVLAHEFGHVAGHHLWQRGLLTMAVFGGWIVGVRQLGLGVLEDRFGFLGFFVPFMGVYLLYHVLLLGGLARWQEFRADAYAVRHAGREATIAALETLADANDTRREAGLLYSLLTHHPSIGERIEAVRDDAETDGSRPPLDE